MDKITRKTLFEEQVNIHPLKYYTKILYMAPFDNR